MLEISNSVCLWHAYSA